MNKHKLVMCEFEHLVNCVDANDNCKANSRPDHILTFNVSALHCVDISSELFLSFALTFLSLVICRGHYSPVMMNSLMTLKYTVICLSSVLYA